MTADSEFASELIVNEAEYRDLLLSFDLPEQQKKRRVIICGDLNLVIRKMKANRLRGARLTIATT